MRELFLFLRIAQEKTEKTRLGEYTYHRLNKWNPLSYVYLIFAIPVAVFQEGWPDTKWKLRKIFEWQ